MSLVRPAFHVGIVIPITMRLGAEVTSRRIQFYAIHLFDLNASFCIHTEASILILIFAASTVHRPSQRTLTWRTTKILTAPLLADASNNGRKIAGFDG